METMSLGEIAAALGCPCPEGEENAVIKQVVTDSREAVRGSLFVAIQGDRFDGHDFIAKALENGASYAVASRRGEYPHPERILYVEDTKRAHIAIGGAYRSKFPVRMVGITGSVGKTTTKEFVYAVLSSRYRTHKNEGNQNNEIGVPKTLFGLGPQHEAAVVEMGMTGLGEIHDLTLAVRPDVGIITSVGINHIELLGSRENILKAKLEILDGMKEGSPLVVCADNDYLARVSDDRFVIYGYGISNHEAQIRARDIETVGGDRTRFTILSPWGEEKAVIPTVGRHNVLDALAAFAAGCLMGISSRESARALSDYQPAGMRQRVVPFEGAVVVEDCYNCGPDALRAATLTLSTYPCKGKRIMVLSDMLELGDYAPQAHREAGRFAAKCGIDMLMAYGPLSVEYIKGAGDEGMERCLYYETREELAEAVRAAIRPGDVVWFKGSHSMKLEEVLRALYQGQTEGV